jgi:hypothetical protein
MVVQERLRGLADRVEPEHPSLASGGADGNAPRCAAGAGRAAATR